MLNSATSAVTRTPELALALACYGVDGSTLRGVAGSLPTGVTVITTVDLDGQPCGMTSSAVCSLSADPPLILTCMARESRTLEAVRSRGAFVMNILDADSSSVSNLFASSGEDRFDRVQWSCSPRGLPLLDGHTIARAECDLYDLIPAGDHVIAIGLVVGGTVHDSDKTPLLYFRRQYAGWPDERS